MEDILMDKKYYWIIDGKYYEVSKETYQKLKLPDISMKQQKSNIRK